MPTANKVWKLWLHTKICWESGAIKILSKNKDLANKLAATFREKEGLLRQLDDILKGV